MGMAVTVPRYTVDDLERFPEDGNRYELLDGMLIVTPAPRQVHQWVAFELALRLASQTRKIARVVGPGVVTRPPGSQLEQDILVYPARFNPSSPWFDVTQHWLAVEKYSAAPRASTTASSARRILPAQRAASVARGHRGSKRGRPALAH